MNSVNGSRQGIKRERYEEPPPEATTDKKIKVVTKDLLSTIGCINATKYLLSFLDGISLARVSQTAKKYKTLIDSDRRLSNKILYAKMDKVLDPILKFAKLLTFEGCTYLYEASHILATVNHPKAIELFEKTVAEDMRPSRRTPRLIARLDMFKALALANHPRAHEYLPPIEEFEGGEDIYLETLAESDHPKALEIIEKSLEKITNLFDIGKALVASQQPEASLLLQQVIDLAEKKPNFKAVEWVSLSHPKTDTYLDRAIREVDDYEGWNLLAKYMIRTNHERAIEFTNLALNSIEHLKTRFEETFSFAKEMSRWNHPKASEFLERAILLAKQKVYYQKHHFFDLSLFLISIGFVA